ncbi:MAG: inositol monophosphatase [Microbacteriaceae bacterium]|nr:MAG: inositol monophosphatase [Microbacteriaceae bacterium]
MTGTNNTLLAIARDTATRAGELVRIRRRSQVSVKGAKSTDTDVFTHADEESEQYIRSAILKARPHDGFLGEELGYTAGESGLTWVIDPIDGTANYLYGLPGYNVSIAVVEGGAEPAGWTTLAGCVYDPVTNELFSAAADDGAYLGIRRLQVVQDVALHFALVGTGFGYQPDQRTRQAEILTSIIGDVRDIRRGGAAALDLCSVASGRLDAFFSACLKPWDHAAGALIAREAGAKVGGLGGAAEDETLTLAAVPSLFDTLRRILEKNGAARVLAG